jgi:DNA-binding MarR family transcriptional regulator
MRADIAYLIVQIKQLSDRRFNAALEQEGFGAFNGAQGRILVVLWEKGCQSIHQLSLATSLAPTTLTAMLDRLDEKKLIHRERSLSDRRTILVEASSASLALKARYEEIESKINGELLEGFSSEEINALSSALQRLRSNLSAKGKL